MLKVYAELGQVALSDSGQFHLRLPVVEWRRLALDLLDACQWQDGHAHRPDDDYYMREIAIASLRRYEPPPPPPPEPAPRPAAEVLGELITGLDRLVDRSPNKPDGPGVDERHVSEWIGYRNGLLTARKLLEAEARK